MADGKHSVYEYEYDNNGNRISKTENGVKTSYEYNALNQLTKADESEYLYDEAGNLISVSSENSESSYEYNTDNMLVKAEVNGVVEEYQYDYSGNRISKKSEGEYTYYLNDILDNYTQVIDEIDENGAVKCHYTRGVGLVSQTRNELSYYISDVHDSVRMLADSEGSITDTSGNGNDPTSITSGIDIPGGEVSNISVNMSIKDNKVCLVCGGKTYHTHV